MPLYDFTCLKCSFEFEQLVLKQNEQVACPFCGDASVRRSTVSLFNCEGVRLTKRLTMDSEDKMKKGAASLKKETFRKNRIKIL